MIRRVERRAGLGWVWRIEVDLRKGHPSWSFRMTGKAGEARAWWSRNGVSPRLLRSAEKAGSVVRWLIKLFQPESTVAKW